MVSFIFFICIFAIEIRFFTNSRFCRYMEYMEKPRVFDPRGQAALTPENLFVLTPVKS